jgi:putative transcription factor
MRTCGNCAKFGVQEKALPRVPKREGRPTSFARKKKPSVKEKATEIIEEYGIAIRRAREKKGLTQEELGKLINEKMSVITRLESERMSPNEKLARKLEKTLNSKLLQEVKDEKVEGLGISTGDLTLGDIIKIKKR